MPESQGREHRFVGEMSWQAWLPALGEGRRNLAWEDRGIHSESRLCLSPGGKGTRTGSVAESGWGGTETEKWVGKPG